MKKIVKDLTEKKLLMLNFKKNHVTEEESGANAFNYFSYNLSNWDCLISCANDEVDENGFYYVEFFNMGNIGKFWNSEDVQKLIEIINSADKKD